MTKRIFISVGSRFEMDRLIKVVLSFIEKNEGYNVIAQSGNSNLVEPNIEIKQWLSSQEFKKEFLNCDIFISHAGMGNILLAAEFNKPIIIMPRKAELGEHINNHQLGTVAGLNELEFIHVVNNLSELEIAIQKLNGNTISDSVCKCDKPYKKRNDLVSYLEHFLNH